MVDLIQVLIIVFAAFAWSRAYLRMKDKAITIGMFIFWSIIWLGIILVAIFPSVISSLSSLLGIGRGVDLAVYISIIVLFYLMFRLYVKMDSQSHELTKMTRELALMSAKKKR